MDPRIIAIAAEDGGRGPVLVAAGGRHRSRWAALLSSFAAVGTGEPARLATHGVRGSKHPTGLDAPRGRDRWLPSRSVRFVQCSGAGITRSGAVLHKRCPVACSIAHGCLIDRFRSWPYQCVQFLAALTFCAAPSACARESAANHGPHRWRNTDPCFRCCCQVSNCRGRRRHGCEASARPRHTLERGDHAHFKAFGGRHVLDQCQLPHFTPSSRPLMTWG